MPVELLIGIIVASVAVNLTLLLWLSRADHVKVRWSRSGANSVLARPPEPESQPLRRRALYVAVPPSLAGPVPPTVSEGPHTPLVEMLPPELAEFVSRPATISEHSNGFDHTASRDGASPTEQPARRPDWRERRQIVTRFSTAEHDSHGHLDPLTRVEDVEGWSRIVAVENARLLRYRRPIAVVLAELEGLPRLSERLGDGVADRLPPVIADAFRREARTSDWVARIGPCRFATILPETSETQAINYVERIRIACEPWLAAAAVPLRLAIGWSGPTASSDLEFAVLRAEERMDADRRMAGKAILPLIGVPPAETGRSGEWSSLQPGQNPVPARSGDVSRGKEHPDPARSRSAPLGGTDV